MKRSAPTFFFSGGGLAAAAAIETNRNAVTFNAAGTSLATELWYGGLSYSKETVNYSVQGEILTAVQNRFAFAPEAFGKLYEIEPARAYAGANPIALHGMAVVLRALGV